MHAIYHNSVVMYGLSVDKFFIGKLIALPTSFLTGPVNITNTSIYVGVEGGMVASGLQLYKNFHEIETQLNSLT